jgi:hypothetical protein
VRPTSASGCSSRARARAEALGCCAPRPTGARHSVNTDRTLPRSFDPWALQVLEISDAKITGMHFFLSLLEPERLFPQFRLALHLEP